MSLPSVSPGLCAAGRRGFSMSTSKQGQAGRVLAAVSGQVRKDLWTLALGVAWSPLSSLTWHRVTERWGYSAE